MNELMPLVDDNFLKKVTRDTYFVLSPNQLEKLKLISEAVFKLANEALLEIVNQNEVESWMESRYGINLARIDFARDQQKNLKVLELNTGSCSGWVFSSLTEKVASADKIGIPLAPPPTFYANYVLKKLGPKIAIIICYEVPECDLVVRQIESLGGKAKVIYLSEVGVQDIIDFAPTGLFMFISGDKSFLAVLNDRDTAGAIPKTCVLLKNDLTKNLNFMEQHKAVLKAGDSSRGREVVLGKNFKSSWENKLKEIMNFNKEWIVQELCYLQNTKDNKYEDIAVFVADGVVQGFMSRISANEIVNVVQGGFRQSVVLKYDS
ncbi:65_t:CDS:2 [Gigaspora margarita]|uniref:65_t:CDS:1 n=1 Tax=Gigaspora margarita TaxID=4874 RepID=A0ABM8W727_GIGMA|nr:65_t:CDS:2 [Gigaspora margarita]